jgi:hypothetical protein
MNLVALQPMLALAAETNAAGGGKKMRIYSSGIRLKLTAVRRSAPGHTRNNSRLAQRVRFTPKSRYKS